MSELTQAAIQPRELAPTDEEQAQSPEDREALKDLQRHYREIDVCGSRWECEEGTCPCAKLGEQCKDD